MQEGCFPPPPDLGGATPRSRWNAAALAFLGDSVWEVYMRDRFFDLDTPQRQCARNVVRRCNNAAQAQCFKALHTGGFLTAEELDLLRWAANSSTVKAPSNASSLEYRRASAVEALAAHLYLTDQARLQEVMAHVSQLPELNGPLPPRDGGGPGSGKAGSVVRGTSGDGGRVQDVSSGGVRGRPQKHPPRRKPEG